MCGAQTVELALDLSAPLVIVPDNEAAPTQYIVANLGRFVLRTDAPPAGRKVI
jgi:hypothetical protein